MLNVYKLKNYLWLPSVIRSFVQLVDSARPGWRKVCSKRKFALFLLFFRFAKQRIALQMDRRMLITMIQRTFWRKLKIPTLFWKLQTVVRRIQQILSQHYSRNTVFFQVIIHCNHLILAFFMLVLRICQNRATQARIIGIIIVLLKFICLLSSNSSFANSATCFIVFGIESTPFSVL